VHDIGSDSPVPHKSNNGGRVEGGGYLRVEVDYPVHVYLNDNGTDCIPNTLQAVYQGVYVACHQIL